MNFEENLSRLNADDLRALLKALGERKLPTRKAGMAVFLGRIWKMQPQRFVEKLSEEEKLLLALCVHETPEGWPLVLEPRKLNARFGFSYSLPYYMPYGKTHFILCFFFSEYGEYCLVDGVEKTLRALLEPPPALQLPVANPPDGLEEYAAERVALAEAKRVLQLVASGRLKVSEKTGKPTKGTIKLVQGILAGPETDYFPDRSFAWPVVVCQCGWAKARAGKLGLTKAGKALLKDFTPEGYRDGVRALKHNRTFDEMSRVPEIRGMRGRAACRCKVSVEARRSSLMNTLVDFSAGQWAGLEEAYNYMVATGEDCSVVGDGNALYICDAMYGRLGGYESGIAQVYFRQLVCETLATLGLVDLLYGKEECGSPDLGGCWGMEGAGALTRYDAVEFFRLTPLGKAMLDFDAFENYAFPEAEQRALFKVLPNQEIVVVDQDAFSMADASMLDRIAKQKSDWVWRMDRKSIFQALEAGDSLEDVLSMLSANSGTDLPETVKRLVRETAEWAVRVTGREEAVAVTFSDEETAALVEHERSVASCIYCRQGATLLVRAKNLKKFQGGLRKLGMLLP